MKKKPHKKPEAKPEKPLMYLEVVRKNNWGHGTADKAIKILLDEGKLERQVIGKKHSFRLANGGEE